MYVQSLMYPMEGHQVMMIKLDNFPGRLTEA